MIFQSCSRIMMSCNRPSRSPLVLTSHHLVALQSKNVWDFIWCQIWMDTCMCTLSKFDTKFGFQILSLWKSFKTLRAIPVKIAKKLGVKIQMRFHCLIFCQKYSSKWRENSTALQKCKQTLTNFSCFVILRYFLINSYPKHVGTSCIWNFFF